MRCFLFFGNECHQGTPGLRTPPTNLNVQSLHAVAINDFVLAS